MKNIRFLFQGDSVTDADRDRRNYYNLGRGYAKFTAETLREMFPETEFEFINLGIGGNRTDQLFDRLYEDCVNLRPDIVTVLIGINDIWHRHDSKKITTTDEQFAANYRAILARIKAETNAKLAVFLPYLLDCPNQANLRPDLDRMIPVAREIASEYADVLVELDSAFAEALKTQPAPLYYSADGVHPNENGARFIAKQFVKAVAPLIKE